MHTIELKTALFFSFLVVLTVLNNIILLITRSCSSVAQASSCFKCLYMRIPTVYTPHPPL